MTRTNPYKFVLAQIEEARAELSRYSPTEFGWFARSKETAKLVVPWLTEFAPELKTSIGMVLNAPATVRSTWEAIKESAGIIIPASLRKRMDIDLEREENLLTVGGDVISKVVENVLVDTFPGGNLRSNGRSDYPDLFLASKDYASLPKRVRSEKGTGDYGAALKGDRPVRVPDGLEIKTCEGRIAVDCHHSHVGLHLIVTCLLYTSDAADE